MTKYKNGKTKIVYERDELIEDEQEPLDLWAKRMVS